MQRIVAIFIAGILALLPSAFAQSGWDGIRWSDRDKGWMTIQLKPGCMLLMYLDGRMYGNRVLEEGNAVNYSAQGSCDARGLAQGRIVVDIKYTTSNPGSFEQRFMLDGTARNGVFEGRISQILIDEQFYENGREVMPLFIKDGCPYFVDLRTGAVRLEEPYDLFEAPCTSEGAAYLRQQIAAGVTAPATPQPQLPQALVAASAPAAASGVDVWASCIRREEVGRDGGIQHLWRLHNTCDSAVIVRYCFRAQFEAAGDENLCRRREMLTQEINAGSYLTFAFNLMPPGTALSDGRTVTSNALIVSGFACKGGNFPDAYFDSDGSFRSRGC